MEKKMSRNINLKVNEKDISQICQISVTLIWRRFTSKFPELSKQLDKSFLSGDKEQILQSLKDIIEACNIACQELDNISPSILQIPDVLSTDAEILEDLPDLEEDGLGVDNGSEEP